MKYPLRFVVSCVQPVTQHFGSRITPLQSMHTERNGAAHPNYINYRLKSEVFITLCCLLCSTCYTALRIKDCHLCNQNSHYKKYRQFLLRREPSRAITKSTLFAVSKDEWDTKEDTGKFMKNALDVLWYAKRHQSGRSDVKQ